MDWPARYGTSSFAPWPAADVNHAKFFVDEEADGVVLWLTIIPDGCEPAESLRVKIVAFGLAEFECLSPSSFGRSMLAKHGEAHQRADPRRLHGGDGRVPRPNVRTGSM